MTKYLIILLVFLIGFLPGHAADNFQIRADGSYVRTGDDMNWRSLKTPSEDWPHFIGQIPERDTVYWIFIPMTVSGSKQLSANMLPFHIRVSAAHQLFWDGDLVNDTLKDREISKPDHNAPLYSYFQLPRTKLADGSHMLSFRINGSTTGEPLELTILPDDYLSSPMQRLWRMASILLSLGGAIFVGLFFSVFYFATNKRPRSLTGALLSFTIATIIALDQADWLFDVNFKHIAILEGILVFSTLFLFFLLPLYLYQTFAIKPLWKWMLAPLLLLLTSLAPWPGISTEHDIRALILLLSYAIFVCVLALRRSGCSPLVLTAGMIFCLIALLLDQSYKHLFLFALTLVLAIELILEILRQQKEKQTFELTSSRLQTELLRRNIKPHFIMNSLTAVLEWIETDPQTGSRFIEDLAKEFHLLSGFSEKLLIPLEDELELCRTHLRLMGLRMNTGFTLTDDISEPSLQVPPALFHTLLENAISHNRYRSGPVTFRLEALRNSSQLIYCFYAPFLPHTAKPAGSGAGMRYIRARLDETFPCRWYMTDGQEDGFWKTTIYIKNAQ